MTDYEKKEILEYPQVWFVGPTATKIRAPAKDTADAASKGANYGYDNSKVNRHPAPIKTSPRKHTPTLCHPSWGLRSDAHTESRMAGPLQGGEARSYWVPL